MEQNRQQVVILDDVVDIELIQEAIRSRIRARTAAVAVVAADQVGETAQRLDSLDAWNLPRDIWSAMWPPSLQPWNLDEDFPLASHRRGVGRILVAAKRIIRALLRIALRPLLHQQTRINYTLALMTRTLADELTDERLRRRALEGRLSRVTMVVREVRGDVEPVVKFEHRSEHGA